MDEKELAEQTARLQAEVAANKQQGNPAEESRNILQKAVEKMGSLIKSGNGSTTEIIGHPGASAEGVVADPTSAFGKNRFDQTTPFGTPVSPDAPGGGDEGGAERRIESARDKSREPGSGDRTDPFAGAGKPVANNLMKTVDDETIDGIPVLGEIRDLLVKSFQGLAELNNRITSLETEVKKTGKDVTEVGELAKSVDARTEALLTGTDALVKSQLTLTSETGALKKSIESQPIHETFPGIAFLHAQKPATGDAVPSGITRQKMQEGLMKSVDAGKLSMDQFNSLTARIDTAPMEFIWNLTPQAARDIISTV